MCGISILNMLLNLLYIGTEARVRVARRPSHSVLQWASGKAASFPHGILHQRLDLKIGSMYRGNHHQQYDAHTHLRRSKDMAHQSGDRCLHGMLLKTKDATFVHHLSHTKTKVQNLTAGQVM